MLIELGTVESLVDGDLAVNALGPVFVSQIMAERGVRFIQQTERLLLELLAPGELLRHHAQGDHRVSGGDRRPPPRHGERALDGLSTCT